MFACALGCGLGKAMQLNCNAAEYAQGTYARNTLFEVGIKTITSEGVPVLGDWPKFACFLTLTSNR